MNTFDLSLDLSKSRNVNPIRLRQGDLNGTTIRALIFDHGALADLSGTTARWAMRLPGGEEYYRKSATVDATACTVTVEVDETQAASVSGRCRGYFQILDGSTVIASTGDALVEVLPDALEGAVPAESYDSAIQDAIDDLNDAIEAIPDTVEDVLEAHPEWTTTVQDGAVTDAKLYQGAGGILARNQRLMYRLDNLLTNALPEGDSATATDAARTPLAGLSLFGRSTQDGTPTPSAPVPIVSVGGNLLNTTATGALTVNGITRERNEDGSFHVYGTSTGTCEFYLVQTDSDFLTLPAGTYTFSGCPAGGGSSTWKMDLSFRKADSTLTDYIDFGGGRTFTLAEETRFARCRIVVYAGQTIDLTFGPMLAPGSVPCPYVPYGFAGLWARGKNLLPYTAGATASGNGVTLAVQEDGGIRVTGTCTANYALVMPTFGPVDVDGTFSYTKTGTAPSFSLSMRRYGTSTYVDLNASITAKAASGSFDRLHFYAYSGNTYDCTIYPQLELGSTATAYQPYAESVTPIDLDGHELRSLPDGTRDELTVDERGHAVLVQRVGAAVIDGNSIKSISCFSATGSGTGYRHQIDALPGALATNNVADVTLQTNFRADSFAPDRNALNSPFFAPGQAVVYQYNATANFLMVLPASCTTVTLGNAWLAENPVTVQYPLATPVTIDLGTVDPVALQGPDLVAQAVPAAPFALTYERDMNVTLARLEAALAALA